MTPGSARVLIADGRVAVRGSLEPLLCRSGYDVVAVGSSFDVLRTLRDQGADLLLIDPDLPGSGVSGVDVVRTLKGATRFRGLPAFFLTSGSQRAPQGVADGTLRFDALTEPALLAALRGVLDAPAALTSAPPLAAVGQAVDAERLRTAVASACREELHDAVLQVVREVAREMVPVVAERLIREEIARLRARHGLESETSP